MLKNFLNKKFGFLTSGCVVATLSLVGCGSEGNSENITQINQNSLDVVASAEDLPKCSDDNEGAQAIVKDEGSVRYCLDGKWVAFENTEVLDTVYLVDSTNGKIDTQYISSDYSCETKPLKDEGGVVIYCGGDSIGVVYNGAKGDSGATGATGATGAVGAKGDSGAAGVGCSVVSSTDTSTVIMCGDKTFTMKSASDNASAEDVIYDSCTEGGDEDAECSIDDVQVSGRSEKGPFLRGALVSAYELLNGRTLKQTGKTFNGEIDADDGLFNIKSVKLSSQYAIIHVSGVYRNEVTGNNSDNAIELRALTNLKGRKTANVNLMTHLEYNRVIYLVTQKGMSVSKAKHQAESEILAAFNIDTTKVKLTEKAEDLTIFGESEGNAALLAISIMLQGNRGTADLKALLSAVSDDLAEDGQWNDLESRAEVADWAYRTSLGVNGVGFDSISLRSLRQNVDSWGLGIVPTFEKYVNDFWHKEYGLKECDADAQDTRVSLVGANSKDNKRVTLICDKRSATNQSYFKDYVWREAIGIEKECMHACNSDQKKLEKYEKNGYWYECDSSTNTWNLTTEEKMLNQEKPGQNDGDYITGSGETNYNSHNTVDSVYKWENGTWKIVNNNVEWYTYMFRDSSKTEGMFRPAMVVEIGNNTNGVIYENKKWRNATKTEADKDSACLTVYALENKVLAFDGVKFICRGDHNWSREWNDFPDNSSFFNDSNSYGSLEYAGQTYRTVTIGTQTWMAENLNYDPGDVADIGEGAWHGCYNNNEVNCSRFGRLYTWDVAMNGYACADDETCKSSEEYQGICPEGWHIPSSAEIITMLKVSGKKIRANNWLAGDDVFGLSFLPSGYGYNNGFFQVLGSITLLWSSSEDDDNGSYYLFLDDSGAQVYHGNNRNDAFSVRCVKDSD